MSKSADQNQQETDSAVDHTSEQKINWTFKWAGKKEEVKKLEKKNNRNSREVSRHQLINLFQNEIWNGTVRTDGRTDEIPARLINFHMQMFNIWYSFVLVYECVCMRALFDWNFLKIDLPVIYGCQERSQGGSEAPAQFDRRLSD